MLMRKSFLTLFLVFVYIWSWSIFNVANANDKTNAIIGHVITETIKGTDIDSVEILEKELANLAHKYALDMVKVIEMYLPQILEGVAADLRLKADKKYKCELLKNGGMSDGCI